MPNVSTPQHPFRTGCCWKLRALATARLAGHTSILHRPSRKDVSLFTPQQLFGEIGSSGDIVSNAPFLERARLERDQERDVSAKLALGGYLTARLIERLLTSDDTTESRRHIRELPSDLPETAHLRGITDALPNDGQPLAGLRLGIMAYAYFLEHEGRLEEALQTLTLAVRTYGERVPPAEFASTALFAGRLNRLLARWPTAMACYAATESAATTAGDLVMVLRSRLGRAHVFKGQGNLPLARATAEDVARAAEAAGLREVQAMAWADIGSVLSNEGRQVEAVQAIYRAFMLTEDAVQRMRTLGDLGTVLRDIGAYEAGRLAFDIVVSSKTSFLVRTNALLELMELESTVGNRMAFERCRGEAGHLRKRMPPSMLADYHYKLGIGLARFGQYSRARRALAAGLELSEAHHINTWYFRFERILASLSECETREPESATPDGLSGSPTVQAVAVGLREFASLTG
jgi:tetratricopeptide (TPR) repeat protein